MKKLKYVTVISLEIKLTESPINPTYTIARGREQE
jgi:hypothetical protein